MVNPSSRPNLSHSPARLSRVQAIALGCLSALMLMLAGPIQGAIAAPLTCRTVEGHRQCLVDVQRSAKNHREYRAIVSIDGIEQGRTLYDCQRRIRIGRDRRPQPFQAQGPGPWICTLLDR
ncbi:MAG: hypothetical protein MH825_00055 [Cyanobacteria bacterium]|nr:hypothetical protein [Cyanobacteriota bacterium]